MNPKLVDYLNEYAQDHQHPLNRATHTIGVPLVLFHILAMLDWVHLGPTFGIHTASDGLIALSLGHVLVVLTFFWYLRLHVGLAFMVLFAAGLCFCIAPFTSFSIVIYVTILAWVLQFIGHGVFEKRSPAFFRNLLQLLIGPLFFAAIYSGVWKPEPSLH